MRLYTVFETTNHIVIQFAQYSSGIQLCVLNNQQICLALKKSKKEVVIQVVN